jgi:glucose/arabinose dehydrogenase
VLGAGGGCGRGPGIIPAELRKPIDRALVEFPADYVLERFITNLTAPTAMAFDKDRNALLVAESGAGGREPRILGFDLADGTTFTVYPQGKQFLGFRTIPFRMYGPVGGMTVRDGSVYVSHRDRTGMGVISALGYDGNGTTVVAGLPAQGDHGVTDLVFGPDGRLYFGVGSATNSGVVGLDNWAAGWVQRHPKVADEPYVPTSGSMRLRGFRMTTPNPAAGLFTGDVQSVTGAYQPFGVSYRGRIPTAAGGKPNAAIYSVQPTGGIANELRVEAHGIRHPLGLAFNRFDRLYATNQGMQLRGTRPVKDDVDSVLWIRPRAGKWYGWPDYGADLSPVTDERFQPPAEMIRRTGYSELNFLVDHEGELAAPDDTDQDDLVRARFPSLSGAAKRTFVPHDDETSFDEFGGQLIVALSGDRAPFATSGNRRFKGPVGYKVVRVDVDDDVKVVHDFIRNTAGVPRSRTRTRNPDMLERPIDVKVGPDGYLYVLDFGRLKMRGGKERPVGRTGQVFRLRPPGGATTAPAEAPAEPEAAAESGPDAEAEMPTDGQAE